MAVVVIRAVSPAMGFTSSQPMAAGRSWSVTSSHWARVRMEWSRSRPLSHSGYQSLLANSLSCWSFNVRGS